MNLKPYLRSLSDAAREKFFVDCDSAPLAMRNCANGKQMGPIKALQVEFASNGAVPIEDTRPDLAGWLKKCGFVRVNRVVQ